METCLICLEPITGTPFQSAKRLTCGCKVPLHLHCFRDYRAAKGHTECMICHNREYIRAPRRSTSSTDKNARRIYYQIYPPPPCPRNHVEDCVVVAGTALTVIAALLAVAAASAW